MIFEKTLAIPLQRRNFKEHHSFLALFTEKRGLMHAVGYGMGHFGSNRAGNLDLFNLCEMELTNKRHAWTISSCRAVHPFFSLKQNLEKSFAALAAIPFLMQHLPVEVPQEKLFPLFLEFLTLLENHDEGQTESLKILLLAFQTKALGLLGHFPKIHSSVCHAPNGAKPTYAVFYNPFSIRCDACLKKSPLPLSAEILNCLMEIEKRSLSEISFEGPDSLTAFLLSLIAHFSETKESAHTAPLIK